MTDLFKATQCDRCGKKPLSIRIMSWFTDDTICDECGDKERELKAAMRKCGMNPDEYEGCGYIPVVPQQEGL